MEDRLPALPAQGAANSSPKEGPGGQGPVWPLIPFSVRLSLSDLWPQHTLDGVFGAQRTPGKAPVKQTDFFLVWLLGAFNVLIAL